MANEVALELAAFLDSAPARALEAPAADVRKLAAALLEIAYEEIGKKPRLFDEEDLRELLGRALPARLGKRDPLAAHVPAVLEAFLDHLEGSQIVPQSFELRRALDERLAEFAAVVESGRLAHTSAGRSEAPLVHKAPKLGRNDPCFCGSGRKFKKCHGQGSS